MPLLIYILVVKLVIFQLLVAANYIVATTVTDDLYMAKVLRGSPRVIKKKFNRYFKTSLEKIVLKDDN